ncbi:MAG: hypothetical protein CVU78_00970 [Elusimicrobia bacterium HGW-Elusimicrobia-2]|nr:MAG: hypothetical protein CVU78_00970 [Elusimicrobia bacterium HGW-Elusimicrobia-2]
MTVIDNMPPSASLSLTPLILAAGFSSRMKNSNRNRPHYPKALLEIRPGVTFLEEIYRKVSVFSDRVIVVLGSDKDEILARVNIPRSEIVYNADFEKGMFSSVKEGLSRLSRGKAFMINPVDCPGVRQSTYEGLIRQWEKSPEKIHIPSFEGRRGHPAIYPAGLVGDILSSPDELGGGLKFFLEKEKDLILHFDTDDKGVIIDVDTFTDYEKLADALEERKK